MGNKTYRRGLIVGKFSPLHKGHEYLIDTARSQCDEIIIISYSRPEFSSCPAALRTHWLQSLYPNATILCTDAAQVEEWVAKGEFGLKMPFNDEDDNVHRAFTFELIAKRLRLDVDAVYTSEEYGDGFARYLSGSETGFGCPVIHQCVDLERSDVPVSGTQLRSQPTYDKKLISNLVRNHFSVRRVCFLGGESTGKSTLSGVLSRLYQEPPIQEYGRTLWEQNNGELNQEDLIDICRVQTHNEDKAQLKAKNYVFCDTSPLTTLCYSEAMFKTRPQIIEAYAERPYHITFLCNPDFPFVQDGTRQDESFRQWQHHWYIKELNKRQVPFILLSGSLEQRIQQVETAISD
ncbi:AAA family ATPase [Litoribacillus peritrichatus]|uniref:Nicotinamide-nucleotide adenylyltransferase n=1 Tax=Litoribacillus peritrichatus TaxID=718191 RepID=A0ABP7MCH8_9GAMM